MGVNSDQQTKQDANPQVSIRLMTMNDYEQVFALWERISGFALRSVDDSRQGIERFLRRNPNTSVVAELDGRIVGSILCGHDGREASFYHVCVAKEYRKHGIGRRMVRESLQALADEHVSKVSLVAFSSNEVGNVFWESIGWTPRSDLNSYEFMLNQQNIIRYVHSGK